ncbi:MAG: hypothetical protein OHK0023_05830 [Anaerolineae bacterium]
MEAAALDKEHLREYIETNLPRARRNRKRELFVAHLINAVSLISVAWVIGLQLDVVESEGGLAALILLTVASLTGALLHGISAALDLSSQGDRSLRRRLLAQAYREALSGGAADDLIQAEKAKKPERRQDYRLTDDGELELVTPEAFAEVESNPPKRASK